MNASNWSGGTLASPKIFVSRCGSRANCANVICSSFRNFPANQLKGETASTPGIRSRIARWRAGSKFATETLLRTTTRSAALTSSIGTEISRNPTSSVTNKNKLTATLKIDSKALRLFRRAFFRMNDPVIMIRSVRQFAFLQVDGARTEGRCPGIMRDENNRLAHRPAERLQDAQNIVRRLGIEIARRFIRHYQGRVRDESAGNG